jgi:hypothetical protein
MEHGPKAVLYAESLSEKVVERLNSKEKCGEL